jgi:hypothetical protein
MPQPHELVGPSGPRGRENEGKGSGASEHG